MQHSLKKLSLEGKETKDDKYDKLEIIRFIFYSNFRDAQIANTPH